MNTDIYLNLTEGLDLKVHRANPAVGFVELEFGNDFRERVRIYLSIPQAARVAHDVLALLRVDELIDADEVNTGPDEVGEHTAVAPVTEWKCSTCGLPVQDNGSGFLEHRATTPGGVPWILCWYAADDSSYGASYANVAGSSKVPDLPEATVTDESTPDEPTPETAPVAKECDHCHLPVEHDGGRYLIHSATESRLHRSYACIDYTDDPACAGTQAQWHGSDLWSEEQS